MQSHIDQQMLLEVGDGSQKKHFIIQFINCALRQTVYLCAKAPFFKSSRILLQHICYFLHGYQSSLWRNQAILGDRSVQNFYFSTLISSGPPVSCVFCSPALFFFPARSFLSNDSKHDSGFWERRWLRCVQRRLYVNVCVCVYTFSGRAYVAEGVHVCPPPLAG